MKMWRSILWTSVFVLGCATLVTIEAQRQGAGQASGQSTAAPQGAGRGGQRGGGGGTDGPMVADGTLIAGVWGTNPVAVDSRGWGFMTKTYVSPAYKRPFWNKAKELLFSGKQVTSYTVSTFDPELYCEVRKHYGFVWFEMQHST